MEHELRQLFSDYLRQRTGSPPARLAIQARDPWDLRVDLALPDGGVLQVRPAHWEGADAYLAFSRQLSDRSRYLYYPYPWNDPERIRATVERALRCAASHEDAAYFFLQHAAPVGHFFLGRIGRNTSSRAHGLQVPYLGLGIADAYQGQGLGSLAVRFLQVIARRLDADAIQLSTHVTNEAGQRTYERAGFEYTGLVRWPDDWLPPDPHTGLRSDRVERQMVYVLHPERRDAILTYLATRRAPGD